jgi:hypothetical protein
MPEKQYDAQYSMVYCMTQHKENVKTVYVQKTVCCILYIYDVNNSLCPKNSMMHKTVWYTA